MNFLRIAIPFLVLSTLFSCDNEVDLNADFVDTPVVFGLIDAGSDTQFVRVTKGFLEDGKSAIDLAADPNNLYYDSLILRLIDESNAQVITLQRINRSKDPGTFSTQGNRAYYTLSPLTVGNLYRLEIQQPDGKISSGRAVTLENVRLSKPPNVNGRRVSFASNTLNILDYEFQFNISNKVAKFEAKMFFIYKVRSNGTKITKEVEIPLGGFTNSSLVALNDIEILVSGTRFYSTIGRLVPIDGIQKEVPLDSCLRIRIYGADESFLFYQQLNGPLDGVAQVRPEFTNIENGIGLFASRSTVDYYAKLNDPTRQLLREGEYTLNHDFVDP